MSQTMTFPVIPRFATPRATVSAGPPVAEERHTTSNGTSGRSCARRARDFEPFFVLVKDDVEHLVDEMEEGPERAQRAVDQGFVAGGFEAPEFGFIAAPRDRKNDR